MIESNIMFETIYTFGYIGISLQFSFVLFVCHLCLHYCTITTMHIMCVCVSSNSVSPYKVISLTFAVANCEKGSLTKR